MFVNCSYIVSFVGKSPSGGKNPWKTAPANPRRSLFEKCFKSWFDTARWWGMSCAFDFLRNYRFPCFLRRVIVIFRQQKNFGPNVIYFVLRVDSWVSLPPGAEIHEKQQMRIQESHFLKIALNLVLTLPDDGECPTLLISCGIIDLGAYCVELWSFFVSKRISVPMSYISFWE